MVLSNLHFSGLLCPLTSVVGDRMAQSQRLCIRNHDYKKCMVKIAKFETLTVTQIMTLMTSGCLQPLPCQGLEYSTSCMNQRDYGYNSNLIR